MIYRPQPNGSKVHIGTPADTKVTLQQGIDFNPSGCHPYRKKVT